MLKPADPVPMPAAKPDAAGRDAETAVPKPEPAADLTPQSPAPPATAPVAEQPPGADDAQTPAEAGQAAVTDTPPTDAPDASADAATDAAAPAPSDVECAPAAPAAPPDRKGTADGKGE